MAPTHAKMHRGSDYLLTRRVSPVSLISVMTLTNRNETRALALPEAIGSVPVELIVGLLFLLVLLIGRAGTGAL